MLSAELTEDEQDSVYFADSLVVIVEDRYIFYTEDDVEYVLVAPEVEVRNDSVFALATDNELLHSFFITQSHELSNQGESYLDALELPTLNLVSKNEGESEAYVWVFHYLEVKGEGESAMYYYGNPELNLNLNGAATVNILE